MLQPRKTDDFQKLKVAGELERLTEDIMPPNEL